MHQFDPAYIPWVLAAGVLLICILIFGIIAIALYYSARRRLSREAEEARLEAATALASLASSEKTASDLEERKARLEQELLAAAQAKAALEAQLASEQQARKEQADLLARSEKQLREAFASLSTEALGRNNELFLSLAKAQLGKFNKGAVRELEERQAAVDRLVKPISEALGKMDAALSEAEKARSSDHSQFMAMQQSLSLETGRLTKALHHSSARGHWGELQLRRVVEMAGVLEYCDFKQQVAAENSEGNRLRPDLVVRLAGGRSIVVDAKAPMEHYLKSKDAENRQLEQELLLLHARDVRARINELGSKAYWNAFDNTPEFVVMFFPSENAFADALRSDAELIDHGVANNVLPASPVTLIALLRAAAYGWRQEKATENAKLIFKLGCELHERFAKEYQHLAAVGSALPKAVDSFNKCAGSAERMLFPTLRKFTSLVGKDLFAQPDEVEIRPRTLEVEVVESETIAVPEVLTAAEIPEQPPVIAPETENEKQIHTA